MHAELIAHQVPGAALGAIYDAYEPAARGVAAALGVPAVGSVEDIFDGDLDAVAICSSSDTHVDLLIAAARGGQGGLLREAGVARPGRGRPRARRDRRRGRPVPDRLQPPIRPGARLGPRGRGFGRGRRAAPGADLEPRSRAAAVGLRQALGGPVPRHDDPRLRHGQVRDRRRGGRGVRARRAPDRAVVRGGRRHRHGGGDARPRGRLPDHDRQLTSRRVRLRPARRGVRLQGNGDLREPARTHRAPSSPRTACGARRIRTSSSSATCRATCANGRRSSGRSRAERTRRCRAPTHAPRW